MAATAQSLLEVAERGDTAGVERLIASGATIDATNASGQTPLLIACRTTILPSQPG